MKVPLESWSFQTKPGVFQTQTKIMAVVTLWVKYGFSMGSKTKPCFQIETNQMFFSIPLFLTVCSCLSQAGVSGWTKLRNDHPKNYQTNWLTTRKLGAPNMESCSELRDVPRWLTSMVDKGLQIHPRFYYWTIFVEWTSTKRNSQWWLLNK